ncbi:DUF5392 family protein [Alkalihalobacterium alkalinitrilicum]|uniref:DUF5392 family protein n=1 Tax=Alkalihalobacterium alkalinitrilicum TaxID=427920 RepID=UPI00130361B8
MSSGLTKNEFVPENARETYLERLQTEPFNAMTIFCEFLQHEERIKKMKGIL